MVGVGVGRGVAVGVGVRVGLISGGSVGSGVGVTVGVGVGVAMSVGVGVAVYDDDGRRLRRGRGDDDDDRRGCRCGRRRSGRRGRWDRRGRGRYWRGGGCPWRHQRRRRCSQLRNGAGCCGSARLFGSEPFARRQKYKQKGRTYDQADERSLCLQDSLYPFLTHSSLSTHDILTQANVYLQPDTAVGQRPLA